MSYLDALQEQFVGASRALSARKRRRWRRGGLAAGLVVLIGAPAVAAVAVWNPPLGEGAHASASVPPANELALLGVLRRAQTEADRGAASLNALKFTGAPLHGIRTDSVRLLSGNDHGIVLIPAERYVPEKLPLPADTPPDIVKHLNRPPIEDPLCLYQLDSDGGGVACHSAADVKAGRTWMQLGHHAIFLVPDGVATVRIEYGNAPTINAPVKDNLAYYDAPKGRIETKRTTFLDASGKAVTTILPPTGSGLSRQLPAVTDPAAPGATFDHAIKRVAISGKGLDARYELLIHQGKKPLMYTVVLNRPACAGKRRVTDRSGGVTGSHQFELDIHPSTGDFHRAQWCTGTYSGYLRELKTGRNLGSFSFTV